MRILALAILTIGATSIGPGAPRRTIRLIRFACVCTTGPTITNAATRRCLSATRRRRAARHSASSIHTSRARKRRRVIHGIARSIEVNRIDRTTANAMLVLLAVAIVWQVLGSP